MIIFVINKECSDGFDVFKILEFDDDGYENISFIVNGN